MDASAAASLEVAWILTGVVSGNFDLFKTGTGTLLLGNTKNTFLNGTTLSQGILGIAAENSLGGGALTISANTVKIT